LGNFVDNVYIFETIEIAINFRSELKAHNVALARHKHAELLPFPTMFTMVGEMIDAAGCIYGKRMPAAGKRLYPVSVS
jgi:hypothetical protein